MFMITAVWNSCPRFDLITQKALMGPVSPSFLMFFPSSTRTLHTTAWMSLSRPTRCGCPVSTVHDLPDSYTGTR